MITGTRPLILAVVTASIAWAHAVLLDSTPGAGATVRTDKLAVLLRFNSRVDAGRSRLMLVLPDRTAKPLPLSTQSSPDLLSASATGLRTGGYVIRWQVLSSDGHISRGEVPFQVALPESGE